ncbi:NUDIX domain-containing protein [Brevibacillus sp. H7]|uniref:NUDIX domain-containing protein n=1 Tax=Brevibacillus sp. H7 TaxID=3349138 RepID=UPI00381CDAF2
MIYRRKVYKLIPEKFDEFNRFFHTYLLPNQRKHGARLVGRWVTEEKNEVIAIWEYTSYDEYIRIEEAVRNDELHRLAQEKRKEMGQLYVESKQDFLEPTGLYHPPKHIVAVFGYITNHAGEVLIVKTYHRSDTWELPGGQVEANETLTEALKREIKEETGIEVELHGLTGVYHNVSSGIVAIGYYGVAISGQLTTSDETKEVRFVKLDSGNAATYFTRSHFLTRALDAIKGGSVYYEAYRVNPSHMLERL